MYLASMGHLSMPDLEHWTSAELLARFHSGEESAAEQIFHRYAERLVLLARSRLSSRLAGKTDPEDVALSAWRSFFVGAKQGQFTLNAPGDLWRLLVSITLHKLYRQARHHAAARRSIGREQSLHQTAEELLSFANQDPSAEEALALAEEVEAIMAKLDVAGRRVLELRLQGEQIAAIAQLTRRSERTVRRILAQIRGLVAARFGRESPLARESVEEVHAPLPSVESSRGPDKLPPHVAKNARAHLDSHDYLLQKMLGAGRFGKVYRAYQRSVDRTVAIKYLRKSYFEQPGGPGPISGGSPHTFPAKPPVDCGTPWPGKNSRWKLFHCDGLD